jgi:hypothetical protein
MYIGVVLSHRRPNDGDIVGEGARTACETRETSCARRKQSKNAAVRTAYADEIKILCYAIHSILIKYAADRAAVIATSTRLPVIVT